MPRSIPSLARRSRPRCRTPTPTILSAPMSRGSKAILASRSTSRRSLKSSAAHRPIPATPATTDPMQIEPSETAFAEHYGRGQAQVVWTTLVADLETPVSAFLKLGGGKPMSFLLESVEGGAVRGRHSIIGIDPDLIWRANGAGGPGHRGARAKPAAFRGGAPGRGGGGGDGGVRAGCEAAGEEDGGGVAVAAGLPDGECPFVVIAEVLDAAELDRVVVVVAEVTG